MIVLVLNVSMRHLKSVLLDIWSVNQTMSTRWHNYLFDFSRSKHKHLPKWLDTTIDKNRKRGWYQMGQWPGYLVFVVYKNSMVEHVAPPPRSDIVRANQRSRWLTLELYFCTSLGHSTHLLFRSRSRVVWNERIVWWMFYSNEKYAVMKNIKSTARVSDYKKP